MKSGNLDLVVHVPHASTHIPNDLVKDFLISNQLLDCEAYTSADLHTNTLAKQAWPLATIVEAEVSRIVVDVERYADDAKEEMAKVGRGVLYTRDHNNKLIRNEVSPQDRNALLDRFYRPHWEKLNNHAAGKILVDLHSYPRLPWPIELRPSGQRPEIDIGYSSGITPMKWVDSLTEYFITCGFEIGHNTPYSGVIDAGAAAAVMIEIRRDIVGSPNEHSDWLRLVDTLKSMPLE